MNDNIEALNIDLLLNKVISSNNIMEVKTRDVFLQNSTEFHNEGLFSTTIFGDVGSSERNKTFGFIELNIAILHPVVYKELVTLSSLYKGIIEGTKYAIFDKDKKDFIESDIVDGKTGFFFFMNHFDLIDFKLTDSTQREFKVKFITDDRYTGKDYLLTKYLVLPAGLRDYKLTESGKVLENEINELYRKLMSVASSARSFKNDDTNKDSNFLTSLRKRMQTVANEIYLYIENLLDGKSKFIQGKWTRRAIMYGTRNVLTSIPNEIKDLEDTNRPNNKNSLVGLYEAIKGILPIAVFETRTRFLQDIFDINSTKSMLIDKKTFKRVPADISEKTRGRWVTDEGLEETINKLAQDSIKNSFIEIDGHYLLLVYEHDGKIDILKSIDTHGLDIDIKDVRPITYGELFYLAIFDIVNDYPAYVTRYPIVNYGGIAPTIPYLKTTIRSKKVKVRLPDQIEYKDTMEYPIINEHWNSSLSVPQILLGALGADFDGDKVSLNFVWSEDSKKELKDKLHSRSYYVTTDGRIAFSASTLTNNIVTAVFTE